LGTKLSCVPSFASTSLERQTDAIRAHTEALALNTAFFEKDLRQRLTEIYRAGSAAHRAGRRRFALGLLAAPKRLEPLALEPGFEIIRAASLAEAIRQIEMVDTIILDLLLPDADAPRVNRLPPLSSEGSRIGSKKIGTLIVRKDETPEVLDAAVKGVIEMGRSLKYLGVRLNLPNNARNILRLEYVLLFQWSRVMTSTAKSAFITGVSSGIGHGLARAYLERDCRVYGISRRKPVDLIQGGGFSFQALDLAQQGQIAPTLGNLLFGVSHLDLVILNAGILGAFGDMREVPLEALKQVMDINLWANKVVLDHLFSAVESIGQVVTISSGASVNGNRGWSGYSISKAALNMMTLLYARERPRTHFCALAPGLIDSEIQDELSAIPRDERFPSLDSIGSKRGTPEMPQPDEAGELLAGIICRLPGLVESGAYADIRKPPIATAD